MPFGNCSRSCGFGGTPKRERLTDPFCCYSCEACGKNEISNDSVCEKCAEDHLANTTSGQCVHLATHLIGEFQGKWVFYLLVNCGFTAFCLLVMLAVVMTLRNLKLFQVSGFKLWLALIFSMMATLGGAVTYTLEPTEHVCLMRMMLPSTALLWVHLILLLKSVRVKTDAENRVMVWLNNRLDASFKRNLQPTLFFAITVIQGVLISSLYIGIRPKPFSSKVVFLDEKRGETYLVKKCQIVPHAHDQVIYFFHFFVCCIGLVESFLNRKMHGVLNEPMERFAAFFGSFNLIVLFTGASFVIDGYFTEKPYWKDSFYLLFFVADITFMMCALFGRKCYLAVRGYGNGVCRDDDNGSSPEPGQTLATFQDNFDSTRLPRQIDLNHELAIVGSLPIVGSPSHPVYLTD